MYTPHLLYIPMKDFVHRISHIFDRVHTFFSCTHGGSESCTHQKTPSVHICTHLVHIKKNTPYTSVHILYTSKNSLMAAPFFSCTHLYTSVHILYTSKKTPCTHLYTSCTHQKKHPVHICTHLVHIKKLLNGGAIFFSYTSVHMLYTSLYTSKKTPHTHLYTSCTHQKTP